MSSQGQKLTELIEEVTIAYRDLDKITNPFEFREQEQYIEGLETQIKKVVKEWSQNYV